MPEVLLKVGDQPPENAKYEPWKDGDVIVAKSDRTISRVHIEHHTRPNNVARDRFTGLRNDPTAEAVVRSRASKMLVAQGTTQIVTNLLNGEMEIQTVPHLRQWVAKRLEHPGCIMFGEPNNERWYLGPFRDDEDILAECWNKLSNRGLDPSDHQFFPWGRLDVRHHCPFRLDSMSRDEAISFESEVRDEVGHVIRPRAHMLPWRDIQGLSPHSRDQIDDHDVAHDGRNHINPKTLVVKKDG